MNFLKNFIFISFLLIGLYGCGGSGSGSGGTTSSQNQSSPNSTNINPVATNTPTVDSNIAPSASSIAEVSPQDNNSTANNILVLNSNTSATTPATTDTTNSFSTSIVDQSMSSIIGTTESTQTRANDVAVISPTTEVTIAAEVKSEPITSMEASISTESAMTTTTSSTVVSDNTNQVTETTTVTNSEIVAEKNPPASEPVTTDTTTTTTSTTPSSEVTQTSTETTLTGSVTSIVSEVVTTIQNTLTEPPATEPVTTDTTTTKDTTNPSEVTQTSTETTLTGSVTSIVSEVVTTIQNTLTEPPATEPVNNEATTTVEGTTTQVNEAPSSLVTNTDPNETTSTTTTTTTTTNLSDPTLPSTETNIPITETFVVVKEEIVSNNLVTEITSPIDSIINDVITTIETTPTDSNTLVNTATEPSGVNNDVINPNDRLVTLEEAPDTCVISALPLGNNMHLNEEKTLSVNCLSGTNLQYQWSVDGNILGQINSVISLSNLKPGIHSVFVKVFNNTGAFQVSYELTVIDNTIIDPGTGWWIPPYLGDGTTANKGDLVVLDANNLQEFITPGCLKTTYKVSDCEKASSINGVIVDTGSVYTLSQSPNKIVSIRFNLSGNVNLQNLRSIKVLPLSNKNTNNLKVSFTTQPGDFELGQKCMASGYRPTINLNSSKCILDNTKIYYLNILNTDVCNKNKDNISNCIFQVKSN